jgi:hypothetical protein
MSSTVNAPYAFLGKNGDYPVEMNFGIRIYDNKGEIIPQVGELKATLKGGLRVNHIGIVPLLDGAKENIGDAEVIQIISSKPENMPIEHIKACGFNNLEDAITYVSNEHKEEFERDGIITIYYFKVTKLNK